MSRAELDGGFFRAIFFIFLVRGRCISCYFVIFLTNHITTIFLFIIKGTYRVFNLKVEYFDNMLLNSFLKGGFWYTTQIIPQCDGVDNWNHVLSSNYLGFDQLTFCTGKSFIFLTLFDSLNLFVVMTIFLRSSWKWNLFIKCTYIMS